MTLTVRNDPDRPAGGYALLEGPGLARVASLLIENASSGLFLAADGRWVKQPQAFRVAPSPRDAAALGLGPEIVDLVPADLQLVLQSGEGEKLGRLFWVDITPSRGRRELAPLPPAPEPDPPGPDPDAVLPEPGPRPPPPIEPAPPTPVPPRRSWLLPAMLLVVVALLGVGATAYALLPRRSHDAAALHGQCEDLGHQAAGLGEEADGDRVRLAEQALAAGCGSQAFTAVDEADWQSSEAAAWYLARFYDPNESGPVFRSAATVHPAWAASYYARWAARSPRHAAALKTLCGTDGASFDDAQLKRACAP